MTDQNDPQPRLFKIGTTTIVEDENMAGLDVKQIRDILKSTYPEVAHATTRETILEDGTLAIHFIARAGHKG